MKMFVLAACLMLAPAGAQARDTTTGAVGNAVNQLVERASCADITGAIESVGQQFASTNDMLLVMVSIAYLAGRADGAKQSRDLVSELEMIRCLTQPDAPFALR